MAGKTFRTHCTCSYCNSRGVAGVIVKNRSSEKFDNGAKEIAVTNLDLLFGDDFTLSDTFAAKRCVGWADIEEELNNDCVECFTRFDRQEFRWEKVFRMPIIGHKFFSAPSVNDDVYSLAPPHLVNSVVMYPKKNMHKLQSMMMWHGVAYPIDHVYVIDKGWRLKKLFPLYLPEASTQLTARFKHVGKLSKFKVRNGSAQRVLPRDVDINHVTSRCLSSGWRARHENDYLEIDLGNATYLTHIGTAGGFPELGVFPNKHYMTDKELSQFQRECKASGYASQVRILKNKEHRFAWCREYELSYRNVVTKKWVKLGTFRANSNATSEDVTDLYHHYNHPGGLYTRFLRIKPVEHHVQPMMRLALYGYRSPDDIKDGDRSKSIDSAQQETIDIVVQEGKNRSRCLDGQRGFYGSRMYRDYYRDFTTRGFRRSGKGRNSYYREDLASAALEARSDFEALDFWPP